MSATSQARLYNIHGVLGRTSMYETFLDRREEVKNTEDGGGGG